MSYAIFHSEARCDTGAGFPARKLRVILDEQEAIEAAFAEARMGDFVVIQPDDIQGTIRLLLEHKEEKESLDLSP